MHKYFICILFGIILFILLNNNEGFNIGCPGKGEPCDDSIFRERCEEHLACVDGICRSAAGGFSRFATSCSVLFKDKGPPKHTGEIGRFDLWKKWASGRASGWDYRWFLVFNNKIQYYVSNQFRGEIQYNTINSIRIVVEGGYNTLHIVARTMTGPKTYILWAGQYYPRIEDFNKLSKFMVLVSKSSIPNYVVLLNENKVVIKIPQYWEDRGDLLGGNEPLLFILEKVYNRGEDIEESYMGSGRQKWSDFLKAREALLQDKVDISTGELLQLGLDGARVCIDPSQQYRDPSRNIYIAYIIQQSDFIDFRIPSELEMYRKNIIATGTRDINTKLFTFYDKFFEYDKKILMCVTVTENITEDMAQKFQYQMGIHRSIGNTKYRFPEQTTFKHDDEFTISDEGKGSGYGQLSLKLHAYSSLALDLLYMSIEDLSNMSINYTNRLVVTHPVDAMARIFTTSNLLEGTDFWIEKQDDSNMPIEKPDNVYGVDASHLNIPKSVYGTDTQYVLDIGHVCTVPSRAPFIAKNTSMLSLL